MTADTPNPIQHHYNIELHIENLVLHGFASKDRHAIGEAIQRELTRLFTEQGIHATLHHGYAAEHMDGGSFQVKQGTKAATIGTQVARSVYGGLGK